MAQKHRNQDMQKRVVDMHAKLRESIFNKIPALNGQSRVYLPQMYFEKLTDEEFIVLWSLPALQIIVNHKTGAYVEERRRVLGLKATKDSRVVKGT